MALASRQISIAVIGAAVVLLLVSFLAVRTVRNLSSPENSDDVILLEDDEEASGVVSHHGDDYSKVARDSTFFLVCDEEADDNLVKGEFEYEGRSGRVVSAVIADSEGADGACTGMELPGRVVNHRVCERNHVRWDCGNWQAGGE